MWLPDRVVNRWALPVRRWVSGDVYRSPESAKAHVERRRRKPASHRPPAYLRRAVTVRREEWNGWPVYEISPKARGERLTIIYLHGGGYMDEIIAWHWHLIAEVVRRAGARCLVPIYPLLPHTSAEELVPKMAEYESPAIAEQEGPTILMGDSAGGGLALASALALRDQAGPQPARLVLLSPFLDVSVSDPAQEAVESKDKILRRRGLAEAGRMYAAHLPLNDPRVSPIFGDLSGLPPITIFTGTHDILDSDSRRLARRAAEAGVSVEMHEAIGAPHVYPVMPTRQGASARREIAAACRRATANAPPAGLVAPDAADIVSRCQASERERGCSRSCCWPVAQPWAPASGHWAPVAVRRHRRRSP